VRKLLITSLLATALAGSAVIGITPASAAPAKGHGCMASDSGDVTVDSAADSVTIKDDPSTGGNNFGCYTNLKVSAGDVITFSYTGTCGGGVPRLYVQFADGTGENTFDSNTTCSGSAPGTISYTLVNGGRLTSFAFINDRGDSGTVTYSNLVIDGNRINF
jgi:hypothetical protein